MFHTSNEILEEYAGTINNEASTGLPQRDDVRSSHLVRRLVTCRHKFGISRLGSITRLDRIGLPVAQTVRPLSLSNAVSQGKGLTLIQAAASSLMESIETWAGEQLSSEATMVATGGQLGSEIVSIYDPVVLDSGKRDWQWIALRWTKGWDFFSKTVKLVPLALVDTVYTVPPIHPDLFVRTTTGLGAGETPVEALVQACLEILERNAVACARRTAGFFDDWQIDNGSLPSLPADLVNQFTKGGFTAAIWQVPSPENISAFWCQLVPHNRADEIAPFPSEGFASDFTSERAVVKALLEAVQARASVISGAREDINRDSYPVFYDPNKLDRWRRHVESPARSLRFVNDYPESSTAGDPIKRVLHALKKAGAKAVIAVPLYSEDGAGLHVVRVVAPPLRQF